MTRAMSLSLGRIHELRAVAGVEALVGERDAAARRRRPSACAGRLPARSAFTASHEHARRIVLRRLPAIVEIAVVGHQELQVRVRAIDRQVDGRREAAQQRRHRPARAHRGSGRSRCACVTSITPSSRRSPEASVRSRSCPLPPSSPSRSGICSGFFLASPGVGGSTCGDGELGRLGARVVLELAHQLGRAGLRVPGHELLQVAARGVLEAGDEILHRRRLPVVALEVEVHALAEAVAPQQRLQHAHDLGALLVDGRRIEVVDLDVAVRAHRMGQRARVLGELRAPSGWRTSRMRCTVAERWSAQNSWSRKTVSPSLRQSWNQSRQVMRLPVQLWKYSCAMTRSMATKLRVGGGLGRGQDQAVVEDVEALVLHRPHVEVGHGDDVEHVEVVLAPEALLVPAHGALERIHRPGAAVLLAGLHVDAQVHLAPRRGGEVGGEGGQVAADQREQVAGLGMRIAPHRVVALAAVERAALQRDCRWRAAPAPRCGRPRCAPCRWRARRGDRGNR